MVVLVESNFLFMRFLITIIAPDLLPFPFFLFVKISYLFHKIKVTENKSAGFVVCIRMLEKIHNLCQIFYQ